MEKGYHKELEKMGISAEGAKTITETFLYYYLSPSLLSTNKCWNIQNHGLMPAGGTC